MRLDLDANFSMNGSMQSLPAGGAGYTVTVGPAEVAAGRDFGIGSGVASVAGRIFNDANGDAVADPGEPGLAAWLLYLDSDGDAVLDPGERRGQSRLDGTYSFSVLPGTHVVRAVAPAGWEVTSPVDGQGQVVTVAAGETAASRDFGAHLDSPPAVVGRSVFYDGSAYDRSGVGVAPGDDAAIAYDKRALLPGQSATFANVTSYAGGINGIMIDMSGLGGTGFAPSPDDFTFRTGSVPDPSAWRDAIPPHEMNIRRGKGVGGSDRITFAWTNRNSAVVNGWLQVTVKTNVRTGLSVPDVFYFGNLVGETGPIGAGGALTVGLADIRQTRAAAAAWRAPTVVNRFDVNRDGRVNALDLGLVKANLGRALPLMAAPAATRPAAFAAPLSATTSLLRLAEELS